MLCVQAFAEAVPKAAQQALRAGQDFSAASDNGQAIAQFKEAIRLAPTFRDAYLHLAVQYDVSGDHEAASAAYDAATAKFPKDGELWAEWGTTLIILKRFDKAVVALSKAVALEPTPLAWQADLAYATWRTGDTEKALKIYDKVFAAGMKDPMVRRQYGDALARHGSLPEAEKVYSELMQQAPNDRDLLYRRAKVRKARGDIAGAASDEAALKALDANKTAESKKPLEAGK